MGRSYSDYYFFQGGKYSRFIAITPTKNAYELNMIITKENGLDYIRNHIGHIQKIVSNNALLVKRLRDAYHISQYQETPYLSGLDSAFDIHDIALADIAIKWVKGDRKTALDLLRADYDFWRRVLASNTSTLTHMLSMGAIQRDLALFSKLLSDCDACVIKNINVNNYLKPFSKKESSLRQEMDMELRRMNNTLPQHTWNDWKKPPLWTSLLGFMFYKKNATLNQIYINNKVIIKLSECDIRNLNVCYAAANKFANRHINYLAIAFLNNPIGFNMANMLASISRSSYMGYAESVQYLEIYRRLLLIKANFLQNKKAKRHVRKYIESLPDVIREPISGVFIRWIKEKNAIGIKVMDFQVTVKL